MSKFEKLKAKIRNGQSVSYDEVEGLLYKMGFEMKSRGSHHVFRKDGYPRNVSVKKRTELHPYNLSDVVEAMDYYEE